MHLRPSKASFSDSSYPRITRSHIAASSHFDAKPLVAVCSTAQITTIFAMTSLVNGSMADRIAALSPGSIGAQPRHQMR
jgi:hypothetical protein